MERFTQGEWVVSEQRDEVSVYMGEAVNSPYEYNCSDVWWCDSYWSEDDETAIANAHLISAAPDMYRALKGIVSNSSIQANFPHECEIAEAALAKADGEKQ